jgi:hypothetical protein
MCDIVRQTIPSRARYTKGVIPKIWRNRLLKVERSPKPESNAIAVTVSDDPTKRTAARRILTPSTN